MYTVKYLYQAINKYNPWHLNLFDNDEVLYSLKYLALLNKIYDYMEYLLTVVEDNNEFNEILHWQNKLYEIIY